MEGSSNAPHQRVPDMARQLASALQTRRGHVPKTDSHRDHGGPQRDDPFSAEFEHEVEAAGDADGLREEAGAWKNRKGPPTAGKPRAMSLESSAGLLRATPRSGPPRPPPKPRKPSSDSCFKEVPLTESERDENRHDGAAQREEWPEPPNDLELANCAQRESGSEGYRERSVGGEGGGFLPAVDEVFAHNSPDVHTCPQVSSSEDLAQTRSQVSRRPMQYQNVELNMAQTHETRLSRRHSGPSRYENVVLPGEIPSLVGSTPPESPPPGLSSAPPVPSKPGEAAAAMTPHIRVRTRYENITLPWEQTTEQPSGDISQEARGQFGDTCDRALPAVAPETAAANEYPERGDQPDTDTARVTSHPGGVHDGHDDDDDDDDDDDSYFSDSEFDDENEEIRELLDDQMSLASHSAGSGDGENQERSSPEEDPLQEVAQELLRTEKAYVDRLHFLCKVVLLNLKILNNIPGVSILPADVIKQIFANLEVIFNFHSGNVLPRLAEVIHEWTPSAPRLGDFLRSIGPFLKLYKEYCENFHRAQTAYDLWLKKSPSFQAFVEEIEKTPECRRLTVRQHLLDVLHRVSKYQSTLKEYLDYLPQTYEDRREATEALVVIKEICSDLDRAMGYDERMQRLKETQAKINISPTIVRATRELLKEDKMKTIAPQTGHALERYIFLFNDILLLCTRKQFGGKHEVKFTLDIDEMQLYDGDNLTVPNTFYVQSKRKAIELACNSLDSKKVWMKTIGTAIDECTRWKLSGHSVSMATTDKDDDIGRRRPCPAVGPKSHVCSLCTATTGGIRRRYQCMGCGKTACGRCCRHKARLEYDNMRLNRVCDECYIIIRNRELNVPDSRPESDVVSVNIKPSDPCRNSGYLQLATDKDLSWKRRWLVVNNDGNLYCFKSHSAMDVWTSLPLARVSVVPTTKTDPCHKASTFKLFNMRRAYFFQADTAEGMQRWISVLAEFADSTV